MPCGPDPEALVSLRALPLATAVRLARLMPAEARRLVRDRAICDVRLTLCATLTRTAAAKHVARALTNPEAHPDAADALRDIIALNGGRALRWRQIADLLSNFRGW